MRTAMVAALCLSCAFGTDVIAHANTFSMRSEGGRTVVEQNGREVDSASLRTNGSGVFGTDNGARALKFRRVPQEVVTEGDITTTRGVTIYENGTTSSYAISKTVLKSPGRYRVPVPTE